VGLAIVVLVVAVTPPFSTDARKYVFVEAIQFALVALALPALVALSAPFSRVIARWDEPRLVRVLARREEIRRTRGGFLRLIALLLPYLAAFVVWRIPVSVDALANTPALVVAEIATFLVVGVAFWFELVHEPPLPPIVSAGQHVVPATIAMWMIWILAYFVGFSHAVWFPSVHPHRPGLSVVADQELSSGTLWLASAAAFLPVIFTNLMRFLRGDDEVQDEVHEIVSSGVPPPTA
jgi:cytochrome c oxidase assembly factor CtaG